MQKRKVNQCENKFGSADFVHFLTIYELIDQNFNHFTLITIYSLILTLNHKLNLLISNSFYTKYHKLKFSTTELIYFTECRNN